MNPLDKKKELMQQFEKSKKNNQKPIPFKDLNIKLEPEFIETYLDSLGPETGGMKHD